MRGFLDDLASDCSYGLRQIRKNLSLALVCVAVLAIGIGSATAVFAILYDAILKPLPYRDFAQLVYVHNQFPQSQLALTAESGPDFVDLSTHKETFSQTAAYYFDDFTMTGAGYAQHVDAVDASATLFPMLGIPPEIGRTFSPEEDRDGGPKVAILSDALWRSAFGADRNVIGRTIMLDNVPYRVIGVMPADFNFPHPATQMWVPLALPPQRFGPGERGDKWLQMIARVAPGLTPKRANAALAEISHGYAAAYPSDYPGKTGWRFSCAPMAEQDRQTIRSWLFLAFGAVICVLLIACVNVSGLLLVRASIRRGEWAVRAALGASRMRLARQILAETGVLVLIGCAAGVALAITLVKLSNQFGPIHRTAIEPWTYLFSLSLCILATFLAGVLPAASASRAPLEQVLRGAGTRATGAKANWRGGLVASQIGIAIALLFTATALSRSFTKLLDVSPGFSPERVWTGAVSLPGNLYPPAQVIRYSQFFQELATRISALPGVESASACGDLPFSSGGFTADLYFPGRPEGSVRPAARFNFVLPRYIETMKIPIIEGRAFTEHDDQSSPLIAVVDRAFVQKYFPAEDPTGKLVANNGARDKPYRIIGVVGSIANRELAEAQRPEIYIPALQHPDSAMFLVARTKGNADITSEVRDALRSMDKSVALFDVETMPARIADSVKLRRFISELLSGFAFVGLLLAALGLYGMLAHIVQSRRREIAIRMALGANQRDVVALIIRHGGSIALAGLAFGGILSFAAGRAVKSLLFGIHPADPWTVAATTIAFATLVVLSTWLPAANAARTNLLASLHEE